MYCCLTGLAIFKTYVIDGRQKFLLTLHNMNKRTCTLVWFQQPYFVPRQLGAEKLTL